MRALVHIIDPGGPQDRDALALETKDGQRIRAFRLRPRLPVQMAEALRFVTGAHPDVRLRSLSSEYNCGGLAFASRRAYVDMDQAAMILEGDKYRRVRREADVLPGDLLLYIGESGEYEHVAVVIEHRPNVRGAAFDTWLLSQWGLDGEYIHRPHDVHPLLGVPSEYWTDRSI